jgi:hypothetical protein
LKVLNTAVALSFVMATFMEPKFPVGARRNAAPVKPTNQTLEDVAEEVLNGMFCHYEPPDPARSKRGKKKPQRGILRLPKALRNASTTNKSDKNRSSLTRRVRWVDEMEVSPTLSPEAATTASTITSEGATFSKSTDASGASGGGGGGGGCSVAQACLDAGLEVGCYGSRQHETTPVHQKVPKMNAQQAILAARAKSPRANGKAPDLIFDAEGNLRYATKEGDAATTATTPPLALPPHPPPPKRKEVFFPELCGARIQDCFDEDTLLASTTTTSSSPNGKKEHSTSMNRRHRRSRDMEDADNSIVNDDEDDDHSSSSDEDEDDHHYRPTKSAGGNVRTNAATSKSNESLFSNKTLPRKSIRQIIQDYQKEEVGEDHPEADWENTSAVSSTFFRRVWARKASKGSNNTTGSVSNTNLSSLPTIKESTPAPVTKQASERPKRADSKPVAHDFDPVEMDRADSTRPKSTSLFGQGFLKKSLSPKAPLSSNNDWDNNIPIVQSGSGESVSAVESDPQPPPAATAQPVALPLRRRSRSAERPLIRDTVGRSFSPRNRFGRSTKRTSLPDTDAPAKTVKTARDPATTATTSAPAILEFKPHQPTTSDADSSNQPLHPAHPLVNNNRERGGFDKDDALERQSYITAHRHGFEDDKKPASSKPSMSDDDAMERQSMITAHRNGFDSQAVGPHPQPALAVQKSASMERPGLFSGGRRRAASKPNTVPDRRHSVGPSSLMSANTPPFIEKQNQMGHDDLLERMSYITANRRDMEMEMATPAPTPPQESHWPHPNGPTIIGASQQSINPRVGRVRSPFRRSRSFDRDNEPAGFHPTTPGYGYDARIPLGSLPMPVDDYYRRENYAAAPQMPNASHPIFSNRSNLVGHEPRLHPLAPEENASAAQGPQARLTYPTSGTFDNYAPPHFPPTSHPGYAVNSNHHIMSHNYNGSSTMNNSMGQGHVTLPPAPVPESSGGVGPPPAAMQYWPSQSDHYSAPYYNGMNAMSQPSFLPSNGVVPANSEPQPKEESAKPESDPTWEERTRQAWERLRGGITTALTFDIPKETKGDDKGDTSKNTPTESPLQPTQATLFPLSPGPPPSMYNLVQSPSYPRQQYPHHQQQQNQGPFTLPQEVRRVSFGAPQPTVYYDDQDENRTMMSYPGQTKKKMKFRGTKIVSGMYDKVRNSFGKVSLSRSTSSESHSHGIHSSRSMEWETGRSYPGNAHLVAAPPHPFGYSNGQQPTMFTGQHAVAAYTNQSSFTQPVHNIQSNPGIPLTQSEGYHYADPRQNHGYR